jgi:dTDP-glucose 4,6-dehydratase
MHPRLKVLWHDLRAPIGPDTAKAIGDVNIILNLASGSHVDRSISDPVPFVQNNVAVALHMLEFARQAKPKLFLQFSTDEVYGPAPDGVLHSEWATQLPSNPYAASKSAQEAIAVSYWRTFGVPVVITNTMNIFGEKQHPEKFVPLCASRLAAGLPVPIHGERTVNGWQSGSRCWLYAGDCASAVEHIVRNVEPPAYPEADRPARYHIVGQDEVSNYDIAALIAELLGTEFYYEWIDFHSTRPGHDRRYALDGSKLADLGWKPQIGLEEGLWRTVSSLRRS